MEPSATAFVAPPSPRRATGRAAALTAVLVAALIVVPGCGTDAGTTTFRASAVGTPTSDAFTSSVGTDQVGVEPPAHVTGVYAATTPGLYGGGVAAVCDPAALVGDLGSDPAKVAAWTGVLGIESTDPAAYVARLTPVVLRADTAVTSHGFAKGRATSTPTVLQAGTTVLVDDRGVPVVQCSSGNPLTAASTDDATYEGADWDGFRPEAVITVAPAPAPLADFVIADPAGGGVVRPIGTTGAADVTVEPAADAPVPRPVAPSDPAADYPGGVVADSDYPLGTPEVTTTYVATYRPPGPEDPAGAGMTEGCRRSGLLDEPFTITLRVRDGVQTGEETGARTGAVTVEGDGSNDGSVALGSPRPSTAVTDPVGPTGTFSAGGRRTYDTSTREGVLNARWSGRLGRSLDPTGFALTIRQTWVRDPDFVAWLTTSGGPEDFSCAYDVTAVRQD